MSYIHFFSKFRVPQSLYVCYLFISVIRFHSLCNFQKPFTCSPFSDNCLYKVHVQSTCKNIAEPSYSGNSMKYLYNFSSSLFQIVFKISVLKNFAIIAGKHLYWSLFLISLQVFSCEHCKVFKNSLFHGTNLVAASSV